MARARPLASSMSTTTPLRSPFDGRRKFKGVLKGIEGADIVIQIEDDEFLLPHDAIDKARVEPRV